MHDTVQNMIAGHALHTATTDRQVLSLSDFTEADIVALETTRAPESSKAFDHELQQTE